jgi:hypothetical protein
MMEEKEEEKLRLKPNVKKVKGKSIKMFSMMEELMLAKIFLSLNFC